MAVNPVEKKSRGVAAQNLLNDEMLKEALKEVRFAAHRAFERSRSAEDREVAWHMLDAANRFHRCLLVAMNQGSAAAKEIDRELKVGRFVEGIGRLVRDRDDIADGMPWSEAR